MAAIAIERPCLCVFGLPGRVQVEAIAEIFNVFNALNPSQINSAGLNAANNNRRVTIPARVPLRDNAIRRCYSLWRSLATSSGRNSAPAKSVSESPSRTFHSFFRPDELGTDMRLVLTVGAVEAASTSTSQTSSFLPVLMTTFATSPGQLHEIYSPKAQQHVPFTELHSNPPWPPCRGFRKSSLIRRGIRR